MDRSRGGARLGRSLPHRRGVHRPAEQHRDRAHALRDREAGLALERTFGKPLSDEMEAYATNVSREIELIDELISGCFDAMPHFPAFVIWSMVYFAVVTSYGMGPRDGRAAAGTPFLGADSETRGLGPRGPRETDSPSPSARWRSRRIISTLRSGRMVE